MLNIMYKARRACPFKRSGYYKAALILLYFLVSFDLHPKYYCPKCNVIDMNLKMITTSKRVNRVVCNNNSKLRISGRSLGR